MPMQGLAFIETPFLSVTAVVADEVLKNSDVSLLGFDTSGNEEIVMRLRGPVGALEAAVESAAAAPLGKVIAAHVIARPHEELLALLPK